MTICHQLLRERALVVNRDVLIPTAGTQTLQKKLVKTKIKYLLSLARQHASFLCCEQTLACPRCSMNRRCTLFCQILEQRKLCVRQTRCRLLHCCRNRGNRLHDTEDRLQDSNRLLKLRRCLFVLWNVKYLMPEVIYML